mmetsp:Transcript_13589/g.29782  ORF Transcript_13589/g.29782 Transcript_13589/m.29782 type:complete len:209 (-) Transcript_13589:526-1152(-)
MPLLHTRTTAVVEGESGPSISTMLSCIFPTMGGRRRLMTRSALKASTSSRPTKPQLPTTSSGLLSRLFFFFDPWPINSPETVLGASKKREVYDIMMLLSKRKSTICRTVSSSMREGTTTCGQDMNPASISFTASRVMPCSARGLQSSIRCSNLLMKCASGIAKSSNTKPTRLMPCRAAMVVSPMHQGRSKSERVHRTRRVSVWHRTVS